MGHGRPTGLWRIAAELLGGCAALAVLTVVCFLLQLGVTDAAFTYLVLLVLISLGGDSISAAVLVILSVLCLDYFFTIPIFQFTITDPQDVFAVIGFLITSLVVTGLVRRTRKLAAAALNAANALRETQAELARVNRVITVGQATTSIAHEVGQPITATVMNARSALRWLDAEPPDLSEVREALGRIARDGQRASDILDRIRSFARKAPPVYKPVDMNRAVLDVIALVESEVRKHDIALQIELAADLPKVQGDQVQLQQVTLNLIMNAIEAVRSVSSRPRKLLVVTDQDDSGNLRVSVRDTGPGLKPDASDRIFEPFYSTKPSGMGIGLSICRSLVEAHGGRVRAVPNQPEGANFEFTIPTCREIAQSRSERAA